jgi:Holliday junction resolvase RusA-like endonuclease
MAWLLWIPFIPPGSNELKRLHFLSVASSRRNVHDMMQPLIHNLMSEPTYTGPADKVMIEATFYWPDKRRRDIGNFAESLKSIIDALVGICFVDDDVSHVTQLNLSAKIGTGKKGIALKITPLAELHEAK